MGQSLLARLLCRLFGGHDDLRLIEPHRLALRCVNCGRVTHGWSL